MNKQETYDYLDSRDIRYEVTEHPAVYTMEEMALVTLPYPESDAKNLFVRDDKKRNYYLITVYGEKRVDLKEFAKANGLRRLTFASEEDLNRYLKLTPGSVTPLGLLHDEERKVIFFLDSYFTSVSDKVGVHPNENTATVWIGSEDLLAIIREHGNEIRIADI